jgi:hypothetical protein
MIEVAGKKAQVVIANPSGITCNGCGFINANRATLTTGQAQLNNGNLTGYQVERGEVTIEGAGMDSSGADYTDIIARSVKVNAGLWAEGSGHHRAQPGDAAHQRIEKPAMTRQPARSWRWMSPASAACTRVKSAWSAPSAASGCVTPGRLAPGRERDPHRRRPH